MFNILTSDWDDETQCTLTNHLDKSNIVAFDRSSSRALIKKDLEEIQDWKCQVQQEKFCGFSRGRVTPCISAC